MTVVSLSGELDLATAPKLVPLVHGLLAQGSRRITIDLDEVTFLDAFTVGLLVLAHRDVARTGGRLEITHHDLCARLLALLGITVFDVPTRQ